MTTVVCRTKCRLVSKWNKYNPSVYLNNPNIMKGGTYDMSGVHIRPAKLQDAEAIHTIMVEVSNALPDPSIYVCDDLDYVKAQLSGNGFGVVACDAAERIVGSFIFRFPGMSQDNLGRDIQFAEEELSYVVHTESCVVLPSHRGQNLQLKMLQYAEQLVDYNKYKYMLATVSPENPASYKTLEKAGYAHITTKEKYGGLVRRIYQKNL